MISTITAFDTVKTDSPLTCWNPDDLLRRQERAQINRNVICAVRVIEELVIDTNETAGCQLLVFDELPRLQWSNPCAIGRSHRNLKPVLRAQPELEFVF